MTQFVEIPASKKSIAFRKPILGVGINDADYMVCPRVDGKVLWCPFYKTWKSMITRCYSATYQSNYKTYYGCTIAPEWLTFSNFKEWMKTQDWKGKQLDKDILIIGNKEYNQKACVFVSSKINNLLTSSDSSRGGFPQGVSFRRNLGKYQSSCSVNGKNKCLGLFTTPREAGIAYLVFKSNLIRGIAFEEEASKNTRLQEALIRHSVIFYNEAICQSTA